jgi:uncharacterized ferritin-like protein (DUF455 family)
MSTEEQQHPLIELCPTSKYFVWSPLTLRSAGVKVLTTPSVHDKARLTYRFVEAWNQGIITLVDADSTGDASGKRSAGVLPDKPIRPVVGEDKAQWCNKKTNILNTIHGIAHAESYAIELFWDVIARFTYYNLPLEFYNEMVLIAGQYNIHDM